MPRIFLFVLSVTLLSCGGDSSVNVSGSTPETQAGDLPYEFLPSIGFSGDLKLDLYLPIQGSPPFPTIVYISGGGWSAGDRTQFLPQAIHMASNGFVGVAIEQFLGEGYRSDPALWARASPLSHVDAGSAPFLLLHGTADQQVPYTQSVMMRDALIEEGVHAELFTAEGAEHGFLNRPLWQNPTLEAMKDFFTRMLR